MRALCCKREMAATSSETMGHGPTVAGAVRIASTHAGFVGMVGEVTGMVRRMLTENVYIAVKQRELQLLVATAMSTPQGVPVQWKPVLERFAVLALISYFEAYRGDLVAAFPRASSEMLTAEESRMALLMVSDMWSTDPAQTALLQQKTDALEAHFRTVATKNGMNNAEAPEMAFVMRRLPNRGEVLRASMMARFRELATHEESAYHNVGIDPLLKFLHINNQFNYVRWGARARPPVPNYQAFLKAVTALTSVMLTHVAQAHAAGRSSSAAYVFDEFLEIVAMVLLAGVLEDNKTLIWQMFMLDEILDQPPAAGAADVWDELAVRGAKAGGCHGGRASHAQERLTTPRE